jgi:hypothetical protein
MSKSKVVYSVVVVWVCLVLASLQHLRSDQITINFWHAMSASRMEAVNKIIADFKQPIRILRLNRNSPDLCGNAVKSDCRG